MDHAGFERRYFAIDGMSLAAACGTAMMMSGSSATTTSSEMRAKPPRSRRPAVSSDPPALRNTSPPQLLGRNTNGVRPTPRISSTVGRSRMFLRALATPLSSFSASLSACLRLPTMRPIRRVWATDSAMLCGSLSTTLIFSERMPTDPLRKVGELNTSRGFRLASCSRLGPFGVRHGQGAHALEALVEALAATQRLADRHRPHPQRRPGCSR